MSMKRFLFLTNYPSPYRVRFFDELGKDSDVTVLFYDPLEAITHRNAAWFENSNGGFRGIQLKQTLAVREESLCLDVVKYLKKDYDAIVISGYSSPTAVLAMLYLRLRRIPFYMEVDGGLIRQERKIKYWLKKRLVTLAPRWLGTGKFTTDYLVHYGAKREKVETYHFSSLCREDILAEIVPMGEKQALRKALGIAEEKMILAIGQFIPRKGFDVLLQAARGLDKNVGIYIVGGEATPEYLRLRQELGLTNVHFLGFQKKDALAKYYKASDLFVLPTREDIWGLVINEAMAYGLGVITTDRCVAGLELVEDGVNGYIVPVEDVSALETAMTKALAGDTQAMGAASLEKIRPYTIETMAQDHGQLLGR